MAWAAAEGTGRRCLEQGIRAAHACTSGAPRCTCVVNSLSPLRSAPGAVSFHSAITTIVACVCAGSGTWVGRCHSNRDRGIEYST